MAVPSNTVTITYQATGEITPVAVHGHVSIAGIDSTETAEYEVSTLESENKEYLLDLPDLGTFTINFNYNLDDPGQKALYDSWKDNGGGELVIVANGQTQAPTLVLNTYTAQVLIKKMGDVAFGRSQAISGACTIRVNSAEWSAT